MPEVRPRLVLTLAAIASLGAPAAASGDVLSAPEQRRALTVALDYWRTREPALMPGGLPACGVPHVRWTRLAAGTGGAASPATCSLEFSSTLFALPWEASLLCETELHEVGHLVLGPMFFAASNPSDPAHSPDSHSPMFRQIWRIEPACRHFKIKAPQRSRPGIAVGAG